MPAPIVPIAARAAARPALAALTRALAAIEPVIAKVAEALARSSGRFKDFVAQALTSEKVLSAIGKAMKFVSVADAAAKLGVALVGVKSKLAEIGAGFGLTGKPGGAPAAAAPTAPAASPAAVPVPAVEQVAVAASEGAAKAIQKTGEKAAEAKEKVGVLEGALETLKEEGFKPAEKAAEAFSKPLSMLSNGLKGLKKVTEAASSFEQLKFSLETLLGSADGAAQAFQMIQDFAGRTPFTLESATEAFRQLWTAGIRPTQENMAAFGNVAAAFGKDLTAVTSAISGVKVGKLEGLEQLGFQVQEQGSKLKITFQGMTTTVGKSSREVAKYLEGLGKTRLADGIEKQANTFTTGFDLVKKAFKGLLVELGGAGLLTALESMDVSFKKIIERARPLAELLGKGLGVAMGMVASAAQFLAEHAGIVISVLAGLSAAAAVASIGEFVSALGTAKTALVILGKAVLANPIGLIVGAIAAVVAALVIFKDESVTLGNTTATVGEWLQAAWKVAGEGLAQTWEWLKGLWADAVKWFAEKWKGLKGLWTSVTQSLGEAWEWLTGVWDSVSNVLVELWESIKSSVLSAVQKILSVLAGFVSGAADILGGLGRIVSAVFTALIDNIKAGINFMIASIGAVPRAIGAAVGAIQEGDFEGAFERMGQAVSSGFGKDFVGDFLGDLSSGVKGKIGEWSKALSSAIEEVKSDVAGKIDFWSDVVHFSGEDLKNRWGRIASIAGEAHKNRPDPDRKNRIPPPPQLAPPVDPALSALEESLRKAKDAFAELGTVPLEKVAEKYKLFEDAAAAATKALEALKGKSKDLTPELQKAVDQFEEMKKAAGDIKAISDALTQVREASKNTSEAVSQIDGPLDDDAIEKFNAALETNEGALAEARKQLEKYKDSQGAVAAVVAKATQELDAQAEALRKNQVAGEIRKKFGPELDSANKALRELEEASAEQGEAKAQSFRSAMEKLQEVLRKAKLEKPAPGKEYTKWLETLGAIEKQYEGLSQAGEKAGVKLAEGIETAVPKSRDVIGELGAQWDKFTSDLSKSLGDIFIEVLKGNIRSFEDFFGEIRKMFDKMAADMATKELKGLFDKMLGGDKSTGGPSGVTDGRRGFDVFKDPKTNKLDLSGLLGTAAMGYGVGTMIGGAVGKDSNYAKLGGQILGAVGAVVGAMFGSPQIGALVGSAVGSLIGSLIKRGLPKASASLSVKDGRATVEAFVSRNKAKLDQIQKYAEEVVKGINDLTKLAGGILLDLPDIKLQIKNNKLFSVIDSSGVAKDFGEDYKAAINYAVLLALKGAKFDKLSPEVEAAIRNTKATTIEGLASDIKFATEVRDLDLEPVSKQLRDIGTRFTEMRARAEELGISLDKIDAAFNRAIEDLKKDILSDLEPFKDAGLTDIQREAKQITESFEEMRKKAELFNQELDKQKQGRNQEVTDLQAELARQQEALDAAKRRQEIFGGADPEDFLPPDLLERFPGFGRMFQGPSVEEIEAAMQRLRDEIARLQGLNESQTPIDTSEIDRIEQEARERLRQRFEDELAAFAGENPFVAQLEALHEQFESLKKSAEAVGAATERVDEAYRKALETMQKQFQEGIQSYLDYGRGLSDLAVRHRDLTKFFDEQREAARALDEALGFTGGGGPNEQLLGEAEAAAFQQLVDEFNASLQDLRDAGLTPTEIAVRDMRDRFAQLREDAALLGLSVDELTRLEVQAIERLRGELDAQLDRYLLSDEEQQQRALDQEFTNYLRDAFALYTYEPGMDEPMEPEAFPGAHELERAFGDVQTASEALAFAFRTLQDSIAPDGTTDFDEPAGPGAGATPGEIVAAVLDFLEPLREGRGMEDLPADQKQAIDSAATQVSLLLEQLRLGMTDDVGALQGALGNLVGLLQQSGMEIDSSLLSLVDALASGDISGFLDDLRNGVIGSTDGFGALIDILLSGDVSLPDLMHQLANGTFDAVKAMLGMTDIPQELADALRRIGQAYEAAQKQQRPSQSRSSSVRRDNTASRQVEERERERESLLKTLQQYEDLALSPAERELKRLNEQFDELRANAGRLGISLERVEAAYQLALEEQRRRVLGQLEPFEDLALSPAERELKNLKKQFDELRASAELLGIPLDRVEAAYQLALEDRRKQEREALVSQLEPYEDLALSPLERELKALDEQFDEIRANAERLGISLERVDAAYELALQQKRDALSGQLEQYEDLALSPVERELKQLNEQFEQMRADAQLLGISLEEVEAAYQLALEQQRKALLDQLAPYEEGALSPAERELQQLNEQFEEMRANALLLGVSLDRVESAYQQAIEDFWERLLGPLQEFRDSLALSELSTLTPEQRLAEAQARFEDLSARALGGDLEAAQQLQGAAQQLLQEAQSFYASGEGYQNLFSLVTGTVDQILASLPGMFSQHPVAEGFDALLAQAGWGYQDSLAARGVPFGVFPGDTLGVEPVPGYRADGGPALDVDLSCVREGNLALREELRLAREQEHVDAVELQKRVDQQSEELREVRALLRRLTSTTQYGGRAQ
jgi:DNA repair exonuclease SbcCD ATPase subunit